MDEDKSCYLAPAQVAHGDKPGKPRKSGRSGNTPSQTRRAARWQMPARPACSIYLERQCCFGVCKRVAQRSGNEVCGAIKCLFLSSCLTRLDSRRSGAWRILVSSSFANMLSLLQQETSSSKTSCCTFKTLLFVCQHQNVISVDRLSSTWVRCIGRKCWCLPWEDTAVEHWQGDYAL